MKTNIEKYLKNNDYIIYSIVGNSMFPLLKNGDKVKLEKSDNYNLFDIVLFKRNDNIFTLHRIIKINENYFTILGDNSSKIDYIKKENILAKLTGIFIGEHLINIKDRDNNKFYLNKNDINNLIVDPNKFFLNRKKEAYYELIKLATLGSYNEEKITLLKNFELMDFTKFLISKKAIHLLGFAIEKFNLKIDENISKYAILQYQKTLKRVTKLDYLIDQISKELSENKINHIFLKGPETKRLYKYPFLRDSFDLDLYVDKSDLDTTKNIFINKLSCKSLNNFYETEHDISLLHKPTNLKIELHYSLNSFLPLDINNLLQEPFKSSLKDKNYEYKFHLNLDNEILFYLVHSAKHIIISEFWYSSIIDYYYLRNIKFNQEILMSSRLVKFKNTLDNYIDHIFSSKPLNDDEINFENILFKDNSNLNFLIGAESRSKISFYISKIFTPYSKLKKRYKVLKKVPILFPFITIYRWFTLPFKYIKQRKINYKKMKIDYINMKDKLNKIGLEEYSEFKEH